VDVGDEMLTVGFDADGDGDGDEDGDLEKGAEMIRWRRLDINLMFPPLLLRWLCLL
jgi:hypothetical protein